MKILLIEYDIINLMSRQDKIVKTSIIGIVVNLILVAFKATIGILVNSIAITLDAVNNLTDALSSIITIIGTKLAGRAPDKNHPYGYGRIEYFSSVIIAAIVLWAGITALMESWPKIFNPDVTSYNTVSLVIIAVAVVVKFALGKYVKNVGENITCCLWKRCVFRCNTFTFNTHCSYHINILAYFS